MDSDKNKPKYSNKIDQYKAEIESLKKELSNCSQKVEQLQAIQVSLQNILDKSTKALIVGNKKGQIIDANQKALKLTQFEIKEILQKNIHDILVNEDIPLSSSKKLIRKSDGQLSNEQILIRKNGKKIYVSTKIEILRDNKYHVFIKSINKRKKAELALEDIQNRYRQLAENIQDVIWTASKDFKIVYISNSISKITGFPPEIYYQKPLYELVTPISHQIIIDTFIKEHELFKTKHGRKSDYTKAIEIKMLQRQHSSVWVEINASAMHDHFGEIAGFQGIIRNIDDQKKTQEILEKNNQKYNFAIRTTGSGVWELNADLTKISIDENLLNILGYQRRQAKAYLNDWIDLTFKEDRTLIIDILQDILDGKKFSDSYECRRISKKGNIVWFLDYVEAVRDNKGNIIELLGTSKNITNEKITEEKKYKYYAGLQKLIESTFQFLQFDSLEQIYNYTGQVLVQNIPDSMVIISTINPKTNEISPIQYFGSNEPDFVKLIEKDNNNSIKSDYKLSTRAKNLLSQKILIEFREEFNELIQIILPKEIYIKIKDYSKTHRLYIMGVENKKTTTEAIFIIVKEEHELQNKEFIEAFISLSSIISDKKKVEYELKRTNETKDKFFSIISHDLKNPFNTLIGFSGLIMQNIDTISKEKTFEFAKMINTSAVQNHEMMLNLFEWVNSQKGILKCKPVKIEIDELISANVELFSSEAAKKEITLESKSEPLTAFYADKDMLNTIFRNLISNAIKFTNNGGHIIISYKLENHSVLFSVKDNGVGVPKENQKMLFFLSSNKSTMGTNKEKGTGLGLLLCNEFVGYHGGKLWVESQEGEGSEFLFTIPQKK